MAGMEHLWPTDTGADCQFHFLPEYQLPSDYRPPPFLVVGRDRLSTGWCAESLGPA